MCVFIFRWSVLFTLAPCSLTYCLVPLVALCILQEVPKLLSEVLGMRTPCPPLTEIATGHRAELRVRSAPRQIPGGSSLGEYTAQQAAAAAAATKSTGQQAGAVGAAAAGGSGVEQHAYGGAGTSGGVGEGMEVDAEISAAAPAITSGHSGHPERGVGTSAGMGRGMRVASVASLAEIAAGISAAHEVLAATDSAADACAGAAVARPNSSSTAPIVVTAHAAVNYSGWYDCPGATIATRPYPGTEWGVQLDAVIYADIATSIQLQLACFLTEQKESGELMKWVCAQLTDLEGLQEDISNLTGVSGEKGQLRQFKKELEQKTSDWAVLLLGSGGPILDLWWAAGGDDVKFVLGVLTDVQELLQQDDPRLLQLAGAVLSNSNLEKQQLSAVAALQAYLVRSCTDGGLQMGVSYFAQWLGAGDGEFPYIRKNTIPWYASKALGELKLGSSFGLGVIKVVFAEALNEQEGPRAQRQWVEVLPTATVWRKKGVRHQPAPLQQPVQQQQQERADEVEGEGAKQHRQQQAIQHQPVQLQQQQEKEMGMEGMVMVRVERDLAVGYGLGMVPLAQSYQQQEELQVEGGDVVEDVEMDPGGAVGGLGMATAADAAPIAAAAPSVAAAGGVVEGQGPLMVAVPLHAAHQLEQQQQQEMSPRSVKRSREQQQQQLAWAQQMQLQQQQQQHAEQRDQQQREEEGMVPLKRARSLPDVRQAGKSMR